MHVDIKRAKIDDVFIWAILTCFLGKLNFINVSSSSRIDLEVITWFMG